MRLFSAVALVAGGAVLVLVFYPLLPAGLKDAVAIDQEDIEAVREIVPEQFAPATAERLSARAPEAGATGAAAAADPSPPIGRTKLDEQRAFLLGLLNADRAAFGRSPVELGSNPAAQEHAEEMLEHGYLSHWDFDGMKPWKVNLGIACSRICCTAVQQFEGDCVEFEDPPVLSSGVLSVAGKLMGGFEFSGIHVWYDQPPHSLTLGQLDRTICYHMGDKPVAFLREPLPSGTFYVPDPDSYTWDACGSPYDVSPDAPRLEPGSAVPREPRSGLSPVPWLTART